MTSQITTNIAQTTIRLSQTITNEQNIQQQQQQQKIIISFFFFSSKIVPREIIWLWVFFNDVGSYTILDSLAQLIFATCIISLSLSLSQQFSFSLWSFNFINTGNCKISCIKGFFLVMLIYSSFLFINFYNLNILIIMLENIPRLTTI